MPVSEQVYIIAEAGVNHNGSIERALEMIDVAAGSGVDAVKFQTFTASRLVSTGAPKAEYQCAATGTAESQHDMLRRLELDEEAHLRLVQRCREKKVQFLSTPFDLESVDLLGRGLNLPLLKLPSGEITNGPLLLAAARTGKPVILSTGMCTLADIEEALGVLAFGYLERDATPGLTAFRQAFLSPEGQRALAERVTLLHCTTEYPAPFDEVNLRAMDTIAAAFGLPVGFSDHTNGIVIPVAAVARGAVVVEKHFTLDKALPGPDHKASLEPAELGEMVRAIRQVEQALGSALKMPASSERKNIEVARKSIVAARAIEAGEVFSAGNLMVKRPGGGLSPMLFWGLLGRRAPRSFSPDEAVEL